jgi:hypothetical protein
LVFVSWSLGNLDYGEPIGKEFRSRIEAKFFAHYLKDEPGFDSRKHRQLPDRLEHLAVLRALPAPRQSRPTSLYLAGAGLLSWSASTTDGHRILRQAILQIRFPIVTAPSSPLTPTARSGTTGSLKISAS